MMAFFPGAGSASKWPPGGGQWSWPQRFGVLKGWEAPETQKLLTCFLDVQSSVNQYKTSLLLNCSHGSKSSELMGVESSRKIPGLDEDETCWTYFSRQEGLKPLSEWTLWQATGEGCLFRVFILEVSLLISA